jgi:cytochrome c-type protein NapB
MRGQNREGVLMAEQPVASSSTQKRPLATHFRLVFIGLVVLLMGATVYVLGTSWNAGQEAAQITQGSASRQLALPVEPVSLDTGSLGYLAEMGTYPRQRPENGSGRTLTVYHERRAYNGAPPWIPHPVMDDGDFGGKSCLNCHANGTYAPELQAFAPIVPHPHLTACTQCHVHVRAEEGDELFAPSNWQRPAPLPTIPAALPGAPPPVPHTVQMRENCAACHAGVAVPTELVTDHIERDSCQQCHVANQTNDVWLRTPQEVP